MSWDRIGGAWERFSDFAIVALFLLALGALAFGAYEAHQANEYAQTAAAASTAAAIDAQHLKTFTAHTHVQNVRTQAEISEKQSTIIKQNAEVDYLLGVVLYQQDQIASSHAETANELAQIKAIEQQALAGLAAGQQQLLMCAQLRTPAACGG